MYEQGDAVELCSSFPLVWSSIYLSVFKSWCGKQRDDIITDTQSKSQNKVRDDGWPLPKAGNGTPIASHPLMAVQRRSKLMGLEKP